ncbi:MAG TPA: N-acetylmuramoyl-L-alanine amidase [Rhizomicrobium sp.]|nr:N-acetylmuramoyl-L-alanine amidase [Rhizomicrobium sp.]
MGARLIACPSPNHDARPDGARVDILVLHYTGMRTAAEALARLCDPDAKVSAHYTIDRAGAVYAHVPEDRRAWHAGVSYWAGERNVNARSIGIELVNPGHEFGYVPFTDDQVASLIDLASGIVERHRILPKRVLGHSDVAPTRKADPGEFFPWARLAEFGIGVWPPSPSASLTLGTSPVRTGEDKRVDILPRSYGGGVVRSTTEGDFAAGLARYGYDPEAPLKDVVTAFQRHFRPSCVDGIADAESAALLQSLLAL